MDYKKHKKILGGVGIIPIPVCGSGFLDCIHMSNLIFIYTLKFVYFRKSGVHETFKKLGYTSPPVADSF